MMFSDIFNREPEAASAAKYSSNSSSSRELNMRKHRYGGGPKVDAHGSSSSKLPGLLTHSYEYARTLERQKSGKKSSLSSSSSYQSLSGTNLTTHARMGGQGEGSLDLHELEGMRACIM